MKGGQKSSFYFMPEKRLEQSQMQYAGGILLQPVQTLVASSIFFPLGRKCKRVSPLG